MRRELIAMVDEDQRVRFALIRDHWRTPALLEQVRASDHRNTARMKQIVASGGRPTRSAVGDVAAHDAWLLVQHADDDLAFQKLCLALLDDAVKAGEALPKDQAYLYDRVAVAEGRPQRYGTQFRSGQPAPIEDEAQVDERRRSVGLSFMEEYRDAMRETYGP